MKDNTMTDLADTRRKLDSMATDDQMFSAHQNALDTTRSLDTDEYLEVYCSTLRMLLDS